MKIWLLNNDHIQKYVYEEPYGCVCPNCGTAFEFTADDIIIPRFIQSDKSDCKIECPNKKCCMILSMSNECIHSIKNYDDRIEFIYNKCIP